MKSIYAKLVLWSFGTLMVSLLAFFLVTRWIIERSEPGMRMLPRLPAVALDEARRAYETGGPHAAALLLKRLDSALGIRNRLLDNKGRDVATGRDRSALL